MNKISAISATALSARLSFKSSLRNVHECCTKNSGAGRARLLFEICGLAAVLLFSGCSGHAGKKNESKPVERTWLVMGTFASINVRGDSENIDRILQLTQKSFSKVNATLSTYLPDSEISKINASTNRVEVSPMTADILKKTLTYCDISHGAFDPTVRPLIEMWGFNGATVPPRIPSETEIRNTLKRVGFRHIKLSADTNTTATVQSSVPIDLGGIAKGYAVDLAYRHLKTAFSNDMPSMLINLGGNIRCIGSATSARSWKIGVRNPFIKGKLIGSLTLKDGESVATSGNYERYVIIEGKRYAHIISPRTGHPISGMAETTVVAPDATASDALSTSIYVAGIDESEAILKKLPETRAIIIPDRQPIEIWISPSMRDTFTPYDEYKKHVHILGMKKNTAEH